MPKSTNTAFDLSNVAILTQIGMKLAQTARLDVNGCANKFTLSLSHIKVIFKWQLLKYLNQNAASFYFKDNYKCILPFDVARRLF